MKLERSVTLVNLSAAAASHPIGQLGTHLRNWAAPPQSCRSGCICGNVLAFDPANPEIRALPINALAIALALMSAGSRPGATPAG
jgi:hypothetical protein